MNTLFSNRFPLYAKILTWFFLNLVLLILVFLLLLNAQFRLNIDWLLSSGASDRINVLKNLVIGELNTHPKSEWNSILQRFDNAYHVHFLLMNREGVSLAGDSSVPVPQEILTRVVEAPRFRPSGFISPFTSRSLPHATDSTNEIHSSPIPTSAVSTVTTNNTSPQGPQVSRQPTSKYIIRTTNPTRYWLLIGTRVMNPETTKLTRATLIATSSSITQGGLLLDLKPWLALGVGAVIFSAIFWFPLVRSITRSISKLTEATQEIAAGRLNTRVDTGRRDELGALATSVNHMAERLEGLIRGQKRFLGDVAHELCSPLSRLQVAVGILDERISEPHKKYVVSVMENSQQIADLVSELLSFSKASLSSAPLELKEINLPEIIETSIKKEMIDPAIVKMDLPKILKIRGDRDLLIKAISNILRNAIQHSGSDCKISIDVLTKEKSVTVAISDSGPGVNELDLPKIFDPFYRSDVSRDRNTGGIGLGLTIVRTCIEACGGTVMAHNKTPTGLQIDIDLNSAP